MDAMCTTTESKIAVMQAFDGGKKIEVANRYDNSGRQVPCDQLDWLPVDGAPAWNWSANTYRVAVEPLELWAIVDKNNECDCTRPTAAAAASVVVDYDRSFSALAPHRAVRMREVLP